MIISMKIKLYNWLAKDLGKLGREGDTELAHVNPFEKKLLKLVGGSGTINPITSLREFKGGGGGGQSQTSNNLDPNVVPYVTDALSKQQALYNEGIPEYYTDQTYLDPNANQTNALNQIATQATDGNPVLANATNLGNSTIQGDYLSAGNPYFNNVMNTAGRKATDMYNTATNATFSDASQAGRYGSNAHARLQAGNAGKLADSLADTAGQYAYGNYSAERANQNQAMNQAQNLASNQYYDANQLMNAGNQQAGFDQTALNADIARHDYGQNSAQQHLSNYTNAVWGAPMGSTSTTSQSGGGK
jgi:hypothetical protein